MECRALSNKFLTHASPHSTPQTVEWAYSYDIAVNSFIPLFLVSPLSPPSLRALKVGKKLIEDVQQLYVAQLVLAPVVTRSNWVCLWVGNTLYLSAFTQYVYVTCTSPSPPPLPSLTHHSLRQI